MVDLDGGMRRLLELAELLPLAPVYPITAFGHVIDLLAPALRDHPLYRQVCDGLDEAVKRQEGEAAVGDKCRQRATAHLDAGRPLDALRECHQAKVNWFHGDTLYGAIKAMANIVDIYSRLGMYLAAKKYALATVLLARGRADTSDRVLAPIALFAAANMTHLSGARISSAELAAIAGQAHLAWAPDPTNIERHPYLTHALEYQGFTAGAAGGVALSITADETYERYGGMAVAVGIGASCAYRWYQRWQDQPVIDEGKFAAVCATGLLVSSSDRNVAFSWLDSTVEGSRDGVTDDGSLTPFSIRRADGCDMRFVDDYWAYYGHLRTQVFDRVRAARGSR